MSARKRMIATKRERPLTSLLKSDRTEIALARRVQHSLLPVLTQPPGLAVAASFHPAQAVGGDIYDFFPLLDGRLLVAIVDMSGHGLAAALLSVVVQHGIRCLPGRIRMQCWRASTTCCGRRPLRKCSRPPLVW
jgi:serine phosphatase RsbU (regulator of sigma subunit)